MPEHQQIQKSKELNSIFQKQMIPSNSAPLSNPFLIIQRAKINPKSLTRAEVMQLQRSIGNQAVGRLLSEIRNYSTAQYSTAQKVPVQRQELPEEEEPLQGKMIEPLQKQEIPEEEEPLQGKMAETAQLQGLPEEEEPLQGKMSQPLQFQGMPEDEEPLQGKMIGVIQRQDILEEEEPLQGKFESIQFQGLPEEEKPLQAKRENNTGIPDNLKTGVESLSGIDISNVRVHYNSSKPAEVGALAYTQGTDIHVAPGQEKHLPHEAWHVVQQAQKRVRPTMQMKNGFLVNDDQGLEQEADVMGSKVLQKYNAKKSAFELPFHQKLDRLANSSSIGKMYLRSVPQKRGPVSSEIAQLRTTVNVPREQKLILDAPGGELRGTVFKWDSKFDVDIVDSTVMVTIKIKSNISPELFENNWAEQVEQKWSNRFMVKTKSKNYPIIVKLLQVKEGPHYEVKAAYPESARKSGSRGDLGTTSMTEWGINDKINIAHEVGHMLGNVDEYGIVRVGDSFRNYRRKFNRTISTIMRDSTKNPIALHYYLIKWAADNELKDLGELGLDEESSVIPDVSERHSP